MECNPHTGAIGRRQLKLDFAHFCIEEFCASKPHGVTREHQLPKSSRAAILSLLKICSVSSWTESARGCAIFSGCDFTSRANAAATVLPLWRKQIKILFPTKKKSSVSLWISLQSTGRLPRGKRPLRTEIVERLRREFLAQHAFQKFWERAGENALSSARTHYQNVRESSGHFAWHFSGWDH